MEPPWCDFDRVNRKNHKRGGRAGKKMKYRVVEFENP